MFESRWCREKTKTKKTIFCKFSGATNWKQKYPKLAQIIIEKRFVFDSNCPNCYDYLWIEFFKIFGWKMKLEHCHDWREIFLFFLSHNSYTAWTIKIVLCVFYVCEWWLIWKVILLGLLTRKICLTRNAINPIMLFAAAAFLLSNFLSNNYRDICKWKWKSVSSSSFLKIGFNQFLHIGIK